jgi:hypothetical protein
MVETDAGACHHYASAVALVGGRRLRDAMAPIRSLARATACPKEKIRDCRDRGTTVTMYLIPGKSRGDQAAADIAI